MIVGQDYYGANGWLGVCTRCCDVVPVERGRCGNAADHRRGMAGGQRWTPTATHKAVPLLTPGLAFCRACRVVVEARTRGGGRLACSGRVWNREAHMATQSRAGALAGA